MPERPRDHITTDELLAVTGSTRDTLYQWVAQKLLPRPWLTAGTDDRQLVAAWAPETLERVRFIVVQQREGLAADEVAACVEELAPAAALIASARLSTAPLPSSSPPRGA